MTMAKGTRSRLTWGLVVVVVALCWVLSLLGPLSWFIPLLMAFALVRLYVRKEWLALAATIFGNPLSVFFAGGLSDYMQGAPSLHYMGLRELEFYNVDRETRCFRRSGGCVIHSNEWVSQLPHNLALQVASKILGPPSRSYDGPYPDKEKSLGLVDSSPALDINLLRKGVIRTGDLTIQLDPEMIGEFGSMFGMFDIVDSVPLEDESGFRAQAVLSESRCLVLRLTEIDGAAGHDQDFVILIDRRNMRPFAYYCNKGRAFFRVPRVRYLAEDSR